MPWLNLSNMHSPRSWHDCHKIMTEWRESESGKRAYSWGADEAPLDGRRKRHLTLRLEYDNAYVLRLYNTDMVAYEQGGAVRVQTPHSRTDLEFLDRTMPHGMRFEGFGDKAWLRFESPHGPRYARPANSSTVLVPHGEPGRWELHIQADVVRRMRAVLASRRIHALEKRIAKLVDWRAAALRMGLEVDPYYRFMDGYKLSSALIDTPSTWAGVFWRWPPSHLLGVCAQAENILEISTETITPEKFSPPSPEWIARIPQLKDVHELRFI